MITQSALKKYQQCEQMYKYRYIDGYREIVRSDAMTLGTLVHAGLECFLKEQDVVHAVWHMEQVAQVEEDLPETHLVIDQAMMLLRGYYNKWYDEHHAKYETVSVEEEFEVKLGGQKFGGKIDGLIREKEGGRLVLIEHKTSGDRTATSMGGTYWKQLNSGMNIQLVLYQEAMRKKYDDGSDKPPKILYDVLYKNRPKMKDLEDMRVYYMCSYAPFYRKELYYTDEERYKALWDLEVQAKRVSDREKDGCWTRSTSNCRSGFGLCPYFDVCQGMAELNTATNLEYMDDLHPELNITKEEK